MSVKNTLTAIFSAAAMVIASAAWAPVQILVKKMDDEFGRGALPLAAIGHKLQIENFQQIYSVGTSNGKTVEIDRETMGGKTYKLSYTPVNCTIFYQKNDNGMVSMRSDEPFAPEFYSFGYRGDEKDDGPPAKYLKGFILTLAQDGRRFPVASLAFERNRWGKFAAYQAEMDRPALRPDQRVVQGRLCHGMMELIDYQLKIHGFPTGPSKFMSMDDSFPWQSGPGAL